MVSGQTQVSRIGMIPLRGSRLLRVTLWVMNQVQMRLRMSLSFAPATSDATCLGVHCDCTNVIAYPPYPGQAPLSACLSGDVPETCTNGYLARHRWVMVAIRS